MPQILAPQAKTLENVSVAIVVNPPAEIPDTTSLFLSTSSSSSARYKAPAHASSTSYTPHLQKRKKTLFKSTRNTHFKNTDELQQSYDHPPKKDKKRQKCML